MEHRKRGLAATVSALVVFGTLLSANMIILDGFQERLDLTSRAFEENAVDAEAGLQLAAVSFSALAAVQHSLQASSFDCANALSVVSSTTAHSSSNARVADLILSVQGTASYAVQGPEFDNLSALRPFAGFVPGYLNIEVASSASATTTDLTYARAEHHVFHIPLFLDQSISLCHSAVKYLLSRMEMLLRNRAGCSETNLSALVEEANLLFDAASVDGLSISFAASFVHGNECGTIGYAVTILEPNVAGVDGAFTWRLSESGSVSP